MHVIACLSFAVGWLRGGPVERFGVMVLICDYALTVLVARHAHAHTITAASAGVITLFFIGLGFRSDRWWPLMTAAALTLCVMVFILEWANPELSRNAAISAQLGLWIIAYLALIAGVAERWFAGEKAVSDAAVWRRRRVAS